MTIVKTKPFLSCVVHLKGFSPNYTLIQQYTDTFICKLGLIHSLGEKRRFSNQQVFEYMLGSTCLQLHNYIYFNKFHMACFTPQFNQLFN